MKNKNSRTKVVSPVFVPLFSSTCVTVTLLGFYIFSLHLICRVITKTLSGTFGSMSFSFHLWFRTYNCLSWSYFLRMSFYVFNNCVTPAFSKFITKLLWSVWDYCECVWVISQKKCLSCHFIWTHSSSYNRIIKTESKSLSTSLTLTAV